MEIVYSDGRFQVFSENFQDYTEISLFDDELSDEIILEAKLIGDESISVLTSENNFITLDLFDMKKIKYVRPDCLAFNSPQNWFPVSDGSIIFALNSCLYKITAEDELIQKHLIYETICQLDYDDETEDLLILTSDSRLLVVNSKEFKVKNDLNVQEAIDVYSITEIYWFMNSETKIAALLNNSTGKITLIDIDEGANIQISLAQNISIARETDGLRFFLSGRNWLLTLMPDIINELNIGDSILSKFYEMFVKKDFDGIRALSSINLSEIIDLSSKYLLSLAYEERLQENFINSLKFAVKILEEKFGVDENSRHTFSYITANFNRALTECSVLKKINSNGLTVSPKEFQNNLCEEQLLQRLCRMNLHGLAFEIAILLEIDLSLILMDWVKKVIEKSKFYDKDLWKIISDKLLTWGNQRSSQVDYIEVAEFAKKNGKPKLALKLLKFEKETRRKIELLVQLNDYREAVIESVQSGKEDQSKKRLNFVIINTFVLVKYIFDFLVKKLSLTDFFNLANISDNVKNSLISYCKKFDRVLLQILMYQNDKLNELLEEMIIVSSQNNDLENLEKWFQLLRTQRIFEQKYDLKLMGLSMSETLQEISKFGFKASRDFSESIK